MQPLRNNPTPDQTIPSRLKHVCVVEPNADERSELVALFRGAGYATQGFESAERFLAELEHVQRPCCVVSELHFEGLSGREMLDHLNANADPCTVLFLTDTVDVATAVQCLRDGAYSVVEKPFSGAALVAEVAAAIRADDVKHASAERLRTLQSLYDTLTPREEVILHEVLGGRLNKSIARAVDVSVRSVENYRARIYRKFSVQSPAELAVKVTEFRLLKQALEGCVAQSQVAGAPRLAPRNAYGFSAS